MPFSKIIHRFYIDGVLVSKFHQMALSRQEVSQSARKHFWLYIDEIQHFITPSMASILSGARKYRLGLILAHQELRQLSSKDLEVASAVITNPYTRICFRMGDGYAKKLPEGFAHFDANDLQNLSVGEVICRVERAEFDFNLNTQPLAEIDGEDADELRLEIQWRSRQKYARSRSEIEAELAKQQQIVPVPPMKAAKRTPILKEQASPLPDQVSVLGQQGQSLEEPVTSNELSTQKESVQSGVEPRTSQETKSVF